MEKTEKRIRKEFERLREITPPRMLTDLHYGFTPEDEDGKSFVDYSTLVGFIDTATRFEIKHAHAEERCLKHRIIMSLYETMDLLRTCIERLE